MKIGSYKIGNGNPTFVIAEAGVNHNNKLDNAFKMIDFAIKYGANAIKFQTWNTELLQLKNAKKPFYQKNIKNKTYYEIIKNLEPSQNDQKKIYERCKKTGIIFLSTPYDEQSVDFLDDLGVPAFKISSFIMVLIVSISVFILSCISSLIFNPSNEIIGSSVFPVIFK